MNRIKELRLEYGYTQQQLADKLNCVKSLVAMYESGDRNPSVEILLKLSDIFDCSIDYMLGKSDVNSHKIKFNEMEIAFANGIKGLNKENQIKLRTIMEGLLASQDEETQKK